MERKISLTEQVGNLELANKALRNYVQKLQEQLAMYERLMQCCPKLSAQAAIPTDDDWADEEEEDEDWLDEWLEEEEEWMEDEDI
jgi:hypothetical protein